MKDCEDIINKLNQDKFEESDEDIKIKRNAKMSLCISLKEATKLLQGYQVEMLQEYKTSSTDTRSNQQLQFEI